MKLALILCSYSKDPEHALKHGQEYRENLTKRGVASICPVLDLHNMWKRGEIDLRTIENAVEAISHSCTEIIIVEKEGMDVQGVILESLGLLIEMRKFCDIMPVYYGMDNYFKRGCCNTEVREVVSTQEGQK